MSVPASFASYETRLALVKDLLAAHPTCPVTAYARPLEFIDPRGVLAEMGIDAATHPFVQGRSAAQYVEIGDAAKIGSASDAVVRTGFDAVDVQLRSGGEATVQFVDFHPEHGLTIIVFVLAADAAMPTTPMPSAITTSPRIGVLQRTRTGVITEVRDGVVALLGWQPGELLGRSSLDIVHPDDHHHAITNWMELLALPGETTRARYRFRTADGTWRWVETSNVYDPAADRVTTEILDVHAEVEAQAQLAAREELLSVLNDALPVGLARVESDGSVAYTNDQLHALLGVGAVLSIDDLSGTTDPDRIRLTTALTALANDGLPDRFVARCVTGDGTSRYLDWTLRALHGPDGTSTGGMACVADVTEAIELRERLQREASTDALTACLNRSATIAAVQSALDQAVPPAGVAIVFVDLDHFKPVNDLHGHAAGDTLLTVVANRIRAAVRPGEVVGRMGGDEFVVVSTGVPTRDAALAIAERVDKRLRGNAHLARGITVPIAASIGVAWGTADVTADQLLAAADRAMYAAKRSASPGPVAATE